MHQPADGIRGIPSSGSTYHTGMKEQHMCMVRRNAEPRSAGHVTSSTIPSATYILREE